MRIYTANIELTVEFLIDNVLTYTEYYVDEMKARARIIEFETDPLSFLKHSHPDTVDMLFNPDPNGDYDLPEYSSVCSIGSIIVIE